MPADAEVDAEPQRRPADPGGLRLQILGPLRIWRGSVELDVGPRQQAVLLAVLLARAGRPTSTDELAWAIWGDEPPQSALNTIHKYVGALRHLLEPGLPPRGTGSFLQRRGDAYVCAAGHGALDLIDFRGLVEAARHARAEQRNEQALDDYLRALALWTLRRCCTSPRSESYLTSYLAQRTTSPVVLVGHSYGGVVITNAANDNVAALVYVNAFIPDIGETVLDILGGSGSALDVADPTTVLDIAGYPGASVGDAEAFLKPATVHNSFAQDLPADDRLLIAVSQRPIALAANVTPSTSALWKNVPSWAVLGTDDQVIPIAAQRSMAARAGSTTSEVTASHVSMLSHPEATVAAIVAAAAPNDGER